jgi:hypothetical protein
MGRNACTCSIFKDCALRRSSFPQQVSHVDEALLAQFAQVYGVVDALPAACANFTVSGDEAFGFERLNVGVNLPVIHTDSFSDVPCGVTAGMPGQVPDDGRPQSVGVENAQGVSNLLGQSGERLVDAGHSTILAHLCCPSKLHHFFSDASITFKVLLAGVGTHAGVQRGDQP